MASPSQELRNRDQKQISKALDTIIQLAKENDQGLKESYNFRQGVEEFSRDFSTKNHPFGLYTINGESVVYINEMEIKTEEHKKLFNLVGKSRTEMVGVFVLKQGKVTSLSIEREPVLDRKSVV